MSLPSKTDCCGCSACMQACPKDCISMQQDSEGFLQPIIDHDACIHCNKCEKVCPINNKHHTHGVTQAFAACHKDNNIRSASSSGGVFTALAELTIKQGGVVFGAAFSDDFSHVQHIMADTIESLQALRGSKYMQSDIAGSYSQAKQLLDDGRRVFFTGTPCQIEGLYGYLGRSYDNLLCADLICHGVPSPKVWRHYLEMQISAHDSKPTSIFFRKKTNGWKAFHLQLDFENGSVCADSRNQDAFMQAFLRDMCLRPSCYHCKFKSTHRIADLTMADFWGVEKVLPEMDDDCGTSLLLTHSEKGLDALQSISDAVQMQRVDLDAALKGNPAAVTSSAIHPNRDAFFSQLDTTDFNKLVHKMLAPKMTPKRLLRRILRKVKHILLKH